MGSAISNMGGSTKWKEYDPEFTISANGVVVFQTLDVSKFNEAMSELQNLANLAKTQIRIVYGVYNASSSITLIYETVFSKDSLQTFIDTPMSESTTSQTRLFQDNVGILNKQTQTLGTQNLYWTLLIDFIQGNPTQIKIYYDV